MDAYTLKMHEETGESHLFKGKMNVGRPGCTASRQSICQKMTSSETLVQKFTCKNEDDARLLCAKVGRAVCGICTSHLYTSY